MQTTKKQLEQKQAELWNELLGLNQVDTLLAIDLIIHLVAVSRAEYEGVIKKLGN